MYTWLDSLRAPALGIVINDGVSNCSYGNRSLFRFLHRLHCCSCFQRQVCDQNAYSVSFNVYLTNIFFLQIALYIVVVFTCGSLFYINISLPQRVVVQFNWRSHKMLMRSLPVHWSSDQAPLERIQQSFCGMVLLSQVICGVCPTYSLERTAFQAPLIPKSTDGQKPRVMLWVTTKK